MFEALLWNLALTAVLAIVLAALGRMALLRRRPALRHWLWLLLLAKLVTPPLFDVPLLPAAAGRTDTAAIAAVPEKSTGPDGSALQQHMPAIPAVDDTDCVSAAVRAGGDAGGVASPELVSGTQVSYLGVLLAVSLTGTCVLLIVHGIRAAKLCRWLGRVGRENSTLAASCAEVATSLGICVDVRSCAVDACTTPLLWMWRRPLIVMPHRLMDELDPRQLRGIVAHELAHFIRRDHWTNVFVFIVKALLWWNPVVWWAERELHGAQELCCDAVAMDRAGANRRSYASTLLLALDFIQPRPFAPGVLATGIGSKASLIRRFEMIAEKRLSYQLSRWTLLLLAALVIPLLCMPVRAEGKKPVASADAVEEKAETAKPQRKDADTPEKNNKVKQQTEQVVHERPRGNCSISGRVVSAETGKPVENARMYLHYNITHGSIFIRTADDGSFTFKDIPKGPFSLQSSNTAGYQDVAYNPDGKPLPFPPFSLEEGEHRTGIVLRAEPANRISGKIRDENGKVPANINDLTVLGWYERYDGKGHANGRGQIDRSDGSYSMDCLGGKPVYVMVLDWTATREGTAPYPPIYHPSAFSRSEAKPITFDKKHDIEDVTVVIGK